MILMEDAETKIAEFVNPLIEILIGPDGIQRRDPIEFEEKKCSTKCLSQQQKTALTSP